MYHRINYIVTKVFGGTAIKNRFMYKLWYAKQVLGSERELQIVHNLCDPRKIAIDVGANRGLYSLATLGHSKSIFAFEPQPLMAAFLRKFMPHQVKILECAVSDRDGKAVLFVPNDARRNPEASLEQTDHYSKEYRELTVTTVALDTYISEEVGMIKIDVEGHQLAVLKGSVRILEKDRPNIIIELEGLNDDNSEAAKTLNWLLNKRYLGFYFLNGKLLNIKDLDFVDNAWRRDKDSKNYIWNYIFVPEEKMPNIIPSRVVALKRLNLF